MFQSWSLKQSSLRPQLQMLVFEGLRRDQVPSQERANRGFEDVCDPISNEQEDKLNYNIFAIQHLPRCCRGVHVDMKVFSLAGDLQHELD